MTECISKTVTHLKDRYVHVLMQLNACTRRDTQDTCSQPTNRPRTRLRWSIGPDRQRDKTHIQTGRQKDKTHIQIHIQAYARRGDVCISPVLHPDTFIRNTCRKSERERASERASERERERERETGRGAVEIGGARDGGYNGSGNVLQDSALRVRRRVLHKEHTRVSCRKFVCKQDARRIHAGYT